MSFHIVKGLILMSFSNNFTVTVNAFIKPKWRLYSGKMFLFASALIILVCYNIFLYTLKYLCECLKDFISYVNINSLKC
jgi:hypothetical protein